MVNINVEIDDYTNRVLAVIKAKMGVRTKGEALSWFAEEYGDESVEKKYFKELQKKTMAKQWSKEDEIWEQYLK